MVVLQTERSWILLYLITLRNPGSQEEEVPGFLSAIVAGMMLTTAKVIVTDEMSSMVHEPWQCLACSQC
jgi:hypothetical protein